MKHEQLRESIRKEIKLVLNEAFIDPWAITADILAGAHETRRNLFDQLIKQNQKTKFYNEPEFSQVISQRWLQICSVNANYDWKIWKRFWKSYLRKKLDLKEFQNWKTLIRFFLKCLLKNPQKYFSRWR